MQHANEKIKFQPVKSIEEHNSGINQMLKLNDRELVTVSDDCSLKFWNAQLLRVELSISTETITCIVATSPKKDIIIAGCHSGNLITIRMQYRSKKEVFNLAHNNLIRVLTSLSSLRDKYFVSADVCGFIKLWVSTAKPVTLLEFKLEGAISYNSMIEVENWMPKSDQESAVIACALKSQSVHLILITMPVSVMGQHKKAQYQILRTLTTQVKPTCLIQLDRRHLAIAVGSLKEES